jgi:putative transcriptional regulator
MRWAAFALALIGFAPIGVAQSKSTPQPGTGKLLVATAKSHDPDLAQSVVLLIHRSADGAIGLILNQPRKDLYFGGPIPLGVRTLVRSRTDLEHSQRIFGDVYLTEGVAAAPKYPGARTYAGYTGWSSVQLDDEISRGLWKVIPGDAAMVFDTRPDTLWQRLIR